MLHTFLFIYHYLIMHLECQYIMLLYLYNKLRCIETYIYCITALYCFGKLYVYLGSVYVGVITSIHSRLPLYSGKGRYLYVHLHLVQIQ